MTVRRTLADRFRREGLADACVLLVARRVLPTLDLEDWGRHFGLEHRELVDAVDRFKERLREARGVPKPKGRDRTGQTKTVPCPQCGKLFYDDHGVNVHRRSHVRQECRWCGVAFIANGLGRHEAVCPEREQDVS